LVVVHGLAGGSISTWRHENGSLWLEWLTTAIPSLRVLVFGYPASEVYLKSDDGTASAGRVFTFAESLCASLRNYQIKVCFDPNPITFIGHGVGGIIVKNALTYSTARRTLFGDIVDQTHHIVFLDTPHLGLDVTKWKAIYGQLATREAKAQFELWSTTLQDLSTTFADIVSRPDMHITTVESTEPIKTPDGEMLVMPVGSARLFNTSHEIALHMHAVSHLTMCRFEDAKNTNYDMLEREIETQIHIRRNINSNSALEEVGLRPLAFTARTDSELQKLAKMAQQNSRKLDKVLEGPVNLSRRPVRDGTPTSSEEKSQEEISPLALALPRQNRRQRRQLGAGSGTRLCRRRRHLHVAIQAPGVHRLAGLAVLETFTPPWNPRMRKVDPCCLHDQRFADARQACGVLLLQREVVIACDSLSGS
ncbi:hypothetical protein B0T22DRAFT_505214, partial [Podospora appendiculata]